MTSSSSGLEQAIINLMSGIGPGGVALTKGSTRVEVTPEALDLMVTERRESIVRADIEEVTYFAPSLDEPGEYDEVTLVRFVTERYSR